MIRILKVTTFLIFISWATWGQFRYQRTTEVPHEGWYSASLPNNLLTKLNPDFSDIRIYQIHFSDTLEVPYLFTVSEDVRQIIPVAITPFNISAKENSLYFTIKPDSDKLINSATLEFTQQNYNALITVEGSQDQTEWLTIAQNLRVIFIQDGTLRYQSNKIQFPSSNYKFLRFTVSNEKLLKLKAVRFEQHLFTSGKSSVFDALLKEVVSKEKQSIIEATFREPIFLSKYAIVADTGQRFYRNYKLEKLIDSVSTEKGWKRNYKTLHSGILTSFKQDTIQVTPTVVSGLRITIFNADNPPIRLKSLKGWSPEVRMISSLNKGTHLIRYGDSSLRSAEYDLGHFTKEIPFDIPELMLGAETSIAHLKPETQPAWLEDRLWLWGILIVIILMLGFFTMRMLNKE